MERDTPGQDDNVFSCLKSLSKALRPFFPSVYVARDGMNLHAYAFKNKPSAAKLKSLGI